MKRLFTLALILVFGLSMSAQKKLVPSKQQARNNGKVYPVLYSPKTVKGTEFLNENFDSGIPAEWTVTDGSSDGYTWAGVTDHSGNTLDGTPFVIADSDNAGSVDMDEILESPAVDVTSATSVFLSFDQYYNSYSGNEITDVDVWDGTQWVNVYTAGSSDIGDWGAPNHQDIDVTAYKNAGFKVRFHYYNANYDWYWAVDNVVIYEPDPLPDANLISFGKFNQLSYQGSSIDVSVTLANNGFVAANSVNLVLMQNSVALDTITYSNTIEVGDTVSIDLGTIVTVAGANEITVFVDSVNGALDVSQDNDTLTTVIYSYAPGQLVEDFEGNQFLPAGWTQTSNENEYSLSEVGAWYAIDGHSASIWQADGMAEEMLITPQVTLDGSFTKLIFQCRGGNGVYGFGYTTLQMKYSVDGSTWVDLGSPIDLNFDDPMTVEMDLSSIPNGDYYFAFATTSNFSYSTYRSAFVIDNILGPQLTNVAAKDLSVFSIEPIAVWHNSSAEFAGVVKNLGTDNITDYNMYLDITDLSGTSIHKDTVAVTGSSIEYYQLDTNNFAATSIDDGVYTMKYYTELTGEENTANDTMARYLTVGYFMADTVLAAEEGVPFFNNNGFYPYDAQESKTMTLHSTGGEIIGIQFDTLAIEADYDTLYVFDGANTDNLIAAFSGNYSDTLVLSNSDSITLVFHSDEAVQEQGWSGEIIYIPTYTVTFNVTDTTGAALENANINVAGQNLTTDTVGVATIALANDDYTAITTLNGYLADTTDFTVADSAMTVSIVLIAEPVVPTTLTLNVDMRPAIDSGIFDIANDTVFVTGSFFGWAEPGTQAALQTMTDADGDTIYTVTITLDSIGHYEYKYFRNSGWANGEWDGDPNRVVEVAGDTTVNDVWGILATEVVAVFNADVTISPNPTQGLLTITADDNYTVNVFDVTGKIIETVQMTGNSAVIDLSAYNSGIYFVRLNNEKGFATYKVIKK